MTARESRQGLTPRAAAEKSAAGRVARAAVACLEWAGAVAFAVLVVLAVASAVAGAGAAFAWGALAVLELRLG